eukprot:TRINITY_DN2600_c0_g1_i8.p1 TRINITY_DN2600_c0_g1~~TRINITY_DN2600_c0_g1_i8.p1  ORF type:complete len:762 (-),score=194.16 TRINITY_DN2600_c0_g1_i8:180-2465(-)
MSSAEKYEVRSSCEPAHSSLNDGSSVDPEGGGGGGQPRRNNNTTTAVATTLANSSVNEKDRKIGHRRINEDGQVSYKKIETNQLMASIQLGIHNSIGGLTKYPERDLLMQDFMKVESVSFPKGGGHTTPKHSFSDFTFRTFAPVAFRYFRDLFGIKADDFMISICNEPLRELSNPGASGSIFYLTKDDEFILKTVMSKESEFLQKLLAGYYMNLQQNPRTLLPKFFGMFCYQCNQKNIRLIVMNNLLPSSVKMHLKFDLKGSTYKRKASKHERSKKSPTYKDLDFDNLLPEGLLLEPETYNALINTMRRDCRVLESFKIMDYSLLVGIHNLDLAAKERAEGGLSSPHMLPTTSTTAPPAAMPLSSATPFSNTTNGDGGKGKRNSTRQRLVHHSTAMESIQATSDPVDIPTELPPGGIPARNHKGERLLIFLGIIDILQSYRFRKKLEHTFKAMIHDGDTVSVHRPGFYAERFMNFMSGRVFKKIPSPLKNSPSKRTKSVKNKAGLGPHLQPTASLPGAGEGGSGAFTTATEPLVQQQQSSGSAAASLSSQDSSHNTRPLSQATRKISDGGSGSSRPDVVPFHATRDANNHYDSSVPSRSLSTGRVHRASSSASGHSGGGGIGVGSRSASYDRSPGSTPRNRYNSGDVVSINDIRLEHRGGMAGVGGGGREHDTPSKLSVAISTSGRTATPTWTEGTPSFTESSVSEFGTPARSGVIAGGSGLAAGSSQDILRYDPGTEMPTYTETEMVSCTAVKPESEFLL